MGMRRGMKAGVCLGEFLRGVEGKVYGEYFFGLFESIIDKEMIWFLKLSTTL